MRNQSWQWKPSQEGIEKLTSLVRSYFDLGGLHIQINSISAETLKEAQRWPEKFQNLVIRVAGYSAYFVELDKKMQDDIIKRTEHNVF